MLVQHMAGSGVERDVAVTTPAFCDVNLRLAYDLRVYKEITLQLYGGVQNLFNAYQKDFDKGVDRDSGYIYGPSLPRSWFIGRSGELLGLFLREVDLHDLLDALAADDRGNADADVLLAVLAVEVAAAGNHLLLVVEDSLDHHRCACAGSVPCRSADEFGQRGSADHRVGDSLFEFLLRSELRNGNAVDRGFRYERNHRRVAVAADDHAVDVVDVSARGLGQVALEAGRVQCAAHADDAVLRKSRSLQGQIGQRVHRVGNHDDDGAGRVLDDVLDHALHNAGVRADQLLAGHARLAGNARGDDHHVRIGRRLVVVGCA